MRRCILGVAIAVLIAGSVVFGQGQGAAVQEYFSLWISGAVGHCGPLDGGFDVVQDGFIEVHLTTVYDPQTGLPTHGRETDKVSDAVIRNSLSGKSLDVGPGMTSQTLYRYDDAGNLALVEGLALQGKVMVPGYGWIFMETGHVRLDPATWTVLFDSGHSSYWNQDLTSLCEFLQ